MMQIKHEPPIPAYFVLICFYLFLFLFSLLNVPSLLPQHPIWWEEWGCEDALRTRMPCAKLILFLKPLFASRSFFFFIELKGRGEGGEEDEGQGGRRGGRKQGGRELEGDLNIFFFLFILPTGVF